jgi:hypothetical protein
MILKTLKKIYPSKSDKMLKTMEMDIEKCINQGINASELADSTAKLIMTRIAEDESNLKKEDDSRPFFKVNELSSFNVFEVEKKTDNNYSENTTGFPKRD